MSINPAKISVSQEEGNQVLQAQLNIGEQKEYRDLVQILETAFPNINSNQCSGIINRAHTKDNGVLVKNGKLYSLRTKQSPQNNGIYKVKEKINALIKEIDQIPVSEFQTASDFEDFKTIRNSLHALLK
ncbi:hypothetical protein JCM10914A_22730 [Paenibacillus sp. JCM 10914]|uniref:hypothetical protein n=1 Tax=Paenibacillus sp. JCM 10914 TaxID=1236974 RepID=UPI000569E729|nr:hypothetical protein [Paenibacillus sp. JCM 10914]